MTTDVVPCGGSESSPDAQRFLSLLWLGHGVREVRIPKYNQYGQTAAGYFDNVAAAVEAVEAWDGQANVYITLNQVNPALLARAVNRVDPRASAATADHDITEREWLFFDVDATRPSGISSTDAELAATRDLLAHLTAFLAEEGWPEPITCVSGNGCYALYRVALANEPAVTALIKRVLEVLADRFNNSQAHVDTSVSNAARIIALIGTKKMKGDATAERPHRRSHVVSAPEQLAVVSRSQLEHVAGSASVARSGGSLSRTSRSGSLADVLEAAGIEYREQPPDANGVTWYHIRQCPLHNDGRPFECGVGQTLPDGPFAGHCFHPEGAGRGWQDFKHGLGLDGRGGERHTFVPAVALAPGRPEIIVTNRYLNEIAADGWSALATRNHPPCLFQHGGSIAEIGRDDEGRARIAHLTLAGLRGRLDRAAVWTRATDEGPKPARPPRDLVEDIDAMPKQLPILRGIVGTPTFASDGRLDTSPGYQDSTHLYYEVIGEGVPPVPERPDQTDLRRAKQIIFQDWLSDFPFDDRASQVNALAAVVTAVARELIDGPTPLFAIDAPTPGTGKGLLAGGIGIITTGSEPAVMSEPRGDEELRKRVTALLCEGASVVLFDNVKRPIRSGVLAALLTATTWSDRILGRTQTTRVPVRAVWLATGNNLQLDNEIARRGVWIRLDSRRDRPWQRTGFRHAKLVEWMRRHRHELVWAFLVLVQHWIAQGRPAWSGAPLGSYESWCETVGGIFDAANIEGFLENREELYRRADAVTEEWRAFTRRWCALLGDAAVKVGDLLDTAQASAPSIFEGAKDGASQRSLLTRLGKALAERRDQRFGDVFIRFVRDDAHTKGALWQVELAADDATVADVEALLAATSAQHPQGSQRLSASFAEDADVADVVSGVDPTFPGARAGEGNPAATVFSHPRVPQHPQVDSNQGNLAADDAPMMRPKAADVAGCRRCGGEMSATATSNLCVACRAASLAALEATR